VNTLYPHQTQLSDAIHKAWDDGARVVMASLATGGGKTVVFCDTVRRLNVPTCVIAHRSELVAQASLTLARNGIAHRVIGPQSLGRECAALHASELGTMLVSPRATTAVAGVDTLVKRADVLASWAATVRLVVQDEGHHVLRDNKWGKAFAMFPNARGLFVTATPTRADGAGLGAHTDGLADRLIVGPGSRELIRAGFLTDYRVIAPPSDIDYSHIPVTATGDLSLPQLRETVHKSNTIVGDVVKHYLKFAAGQRGFTFTVDVEAATEIAAAYRQAGVPAEAISGKTPTALRYELFRRFQRGELLQLVNCDLLGEGTDVPACSVVSMVRRTESYPLYAQQRGRMMRVMVPSMDKWGELTDEQRTRRIAASDKPNGILLDHVGNFARHAAQDAAQAWSLDRRERRSRGEAETIPSRTCGNVECFSVYERWRKACPYCGWIWTPAERSTPATVDGDLTEVDAAVLARLYGEAERLVSDVVIPYGLPQMAALGLRKQHTLRAEEQRALRSTLAVWAGWQKHLGLSDAEIYRRFWLENGTDIATVQTFSARDAAALRERLEETLNREGVIADEA